jgi:putative SOS response-associated peptidase YedK
MCGRFTYRYTWRQIHEHLAGFTAALSAEALRRADPSPRYNVPPRAIVPVLRAGPDGLDTAEMQWWLIPGWSKSSEAKYATFNARSEDAASKPAFRGPYRHRRCIVPASGFYEWATRADGSKQPQYITRADGAVLYFGGLWDRWADPGTGVELESCTILTAGANAEMSRVHDRMPCIIEPEDVAAWVDPELTARERVAAFLHPAADGLLTMHAVDSRVGNVRNEGEGLTTPVQGAMNSGS